MNENKQKNFENSSIPKAIWSLALPTIIGMLVMAFYNIVDTFFIAQTNDPNQIASVSLSMPIFMMLMALGNLFGVGASSNISRNLGSKNYNIIKNISATSFYVALTISILVTIIGIACINPLAIALGTTEFTQKYVTDYLIIIFIGSPFIICSATLSHIIRSEGNAKTAMRGMLLSTLINIILDPIFIFVLDFGVVGASIATIIANIFSFCFYVIMIKKSNETYIKLSFKDIKLYDKILFNIIAVGTPASITSLFTSISTIVYNLCLTPYGEEAVAAMGIVMKITLIYTMIFMGMSTGVQPLLGYCYGAKENKRLKDIIIYSLKSVVIIGLIFFTFFFLFSSQTISIFINDDTIISYGNDMLRKQTSTAPIIGILFLAMSTMQSTGKSLVAMILSLSRQGFAFIPTILFLANNYGLAGLTWAQPIADLITLIIASIILLLFFKQLNNNNYKL
ncbi:MAG: MATE family efflux transporter [bacterium]